MFQHIVDRGAYVSMLSMLYVLCYCFFQAEDGIRDLVRSRGLGDVYKRQGVPAHSLDARAVFFRPQFCGIPGAPGVRRTSGLRLSLIHI